VSSKRRKPRARSGSARAKSGDAASERDASAAVTSAGEASAGGASARKASAGEAATRETSAGRPAARGASAGGAAARKEPGGGSRLTPVERRRVEKAVRNMLVPPGKRIRLARDYDPAYTGNLVDKRHAARRLAQGVERLAEQQDRLYAQNTYSVLIVLQAMDAAGKDGTIKHVMSGVNPQGCQVFSFKAPSEEELDHDYLWRANKALPERGRIGIFNRSYYEEVLVARVHPEIIARQRLPPATRDTNIWKRRFEQINAFERHLSDNGTVILKFFLNMSRKEQKRRFLERIDRHEKNWKFSEADARERLRWDDYMAAYEDAFNHTSTPWAPWHIVPADHKWYTRLAVCATIVLKLQELGLHYPAVTPEHAAELLRARKLLKAES